MKALKENVSAVLMLLMELAVGVVLLIKPVGLTSLIVIALGAVLMVGGLGAVIRYFRTEAEEAAKEQQLMIGLAMLLGGGVCAFQSDLFIQFFAVLYGVIILLTGLSKVQWTVDMLRLKKNKWYLSAIGAVLTLVCGAVVILDPFQAEGALWTFTGVCLILEAVVDALVLVLRGQQTYDLAEEETGETQEEAEQA